MFVAVCKMSCPFERVHGGGNFLIFASGTNFFLHQGLGAKISEPYNPYNDSQRKRFLYEIYFSFKIRFRSQFSSFLNQNQIFQPKFEFVLYYITKILNLFHIISLDFLSFLDLEYKKFSIHSLTHPFVRPSISYSLIIHFIKIT